MDRQRIRQVLEESAAQPGQGSLRLVLTLRGGGNAEGPPPDPRAFKSRTAYRQALIDRQSGNDTGPAAAEIAERFRAMGLSAVPGPMTRSLVVEGAPETLSEALADEAVESAVPDTRLELIRPVRPKDTPER